MSDTRIIFERLTSVHLLPLRYYLWKRREIKFFDNDGSAKNKRWVKKLLREGKISEIPPVGYVYNDCYGTALDNIDHFYKHFAVGSPLVKGMMNLYGDENINLAYKKEISRELAEFYYINSYLHQEASQREDNKRTLFIPYHYEKYLRLAQKSGAFYHDHGNINIAHHLNFLSGIHSFSQRIKVWLLQLLIIAAYLSKLVFQKDVSLSREYRYAIPVRNPDYQFKFRNRSVDFLLDGKKINQDNTIFLLFNPAITRENAAEIKAKSLVTQDCSKSFIPSRSLSSRETAQLLKRVLSYTIKAVFLGLFERSIILKANNILLPVFLRWSSILQKISFKHFVTLNDEAIDHIGRNILLNKAGAKTWYYAHSNSMGYLHVLPGQDIASRRHLLWSFLYYDYYIGWNDGMINYFKLHPQHIGKYFSIGCLWSQSIVDILEGRAVSNIERKISANLERSKFKTLSFFDSSYLPNSVSPMEDGVTFYKSILKLLEEFPDIFVIVKEKKSEATVLDSYVKMAANTDIFYEQYRPALAKLREHPRCHVTGYQGDPSEIIALSDLTVTYAFSSSTVEALGARRKAIFFDPASRWRGCRYTRIPNFVAHSYEELKRLIHYWLYEVTDKDFKNFLNTYAKDEMDPYLDGKAATRLRKLLEEEF